MSGKKGLEPAAIMAGLVVLGGIALFATQSKKKCMDLPDIWAPDGPLHMTREAQDQAYEAARYKLREYILGSEGYDLDDVHIYVADSLRDCAWEKLESDKQKQVWTGIKSIVNEVNQRAKNNSDEFLQSFHK